VLACLTGHADNRIDPASALLALELTLDIHQRLTGPGISRDLQRDKAA
jgi:hypothetical protein